MTHTNINIPYAMGYALDNAENKSFTVNELANFLLKEVEGFIDEKKTKSYVYAQLRRLQLAGILSRKRQEKVMQYEYSKTELYFHKGSEPGVAELSQVFEQQKAQYEIELNQAIEEKEVLEDLRPALKNLKAEYADLFRDIDNKVQRLTGKINAVDKLYNRISG